MAGAAVEVTFVPHLVPMSRGIHATLFARCPDLSVDLQGLFEARYREEPFVDVLAPGHFPETRHVKGANRCQLAVTRPQARDTVVVTSVIDNLVKGAAGQAIQVMNIMLGEPETLGLTSPAVVP